MTDVFLSYARQDRARVRLIALGLTAEGYAVWWDPAIKPGKKWNDAIRRALDNSAAVVTCWSPASVKSHWVAAESNHAQTRNTLVPVIVRHCVPPIPFNMIQAADLTRWRGDADDPEWMDVLDQVRRLVESKRRGYVAAPPPGEAEGATRAAGRATASVLGGMEDVTTYRISASRGRMGPRWGRMVLGTAIVGAVLTAGLYSAEKIYRPAPPETLNVPSFEPPPLLAPETEITPVSDALSDVPAPPESFLPQRAPPRPRPPAPEPAPPVVEASADVPALEACAARLAYACPAAQGRTAIGFRANRQIDGAERRFLIGLGADMGSSPAPPPSANDVCSRFRAPTPAACETVSFPPAPPVREPPPPPPPPPRSNADALGDFLNQVLTGLTQRPPRTDETPPTTTRPPVADTNAGAAVQATPPSGVILKTNPSALRNSTTTSVACADPARAANNPNCPQAVPVVR